MSKVPTKTSYQKLLSGIRSEITRGIKDLERLVEKQKVLTYWNIGGDIHAYVKTTVFSKGETARLYERLADDLKTNVRTLQQCEQFYILFRKSDFKEGLSWSHYRYLFSVPERQERQKWIARTLKNQWVSKDLKMHLFLETQSQMIKQNTSRLTEPKRGKLYTYRLISAAQARGLACRWLIDCGFANRIEAPESNAVLHNKRLYISVKTEKGYALKTTSSITVDQLYTFKAQVLRVIDGDTLLVLIDQGFGLWTEQRIRLKGIDAPEIDSALGRKAKAWVQKTLDPLPFVIVRTSKSDKYDRYLADIFYLPKQNDAQRVIQDGTYLNQELLDRGLAEVWR